MIENRLINANLLEKVSTLLSNPLALFACIGVLAIAVAIARSSFVPLKPLELLKTAGFATVYCFCALIFFLIVFSPVAVPLIVDLAPTNGFIILCALALLIAYGIIGEINKRRAPIGAWSKVSVFAATLSIALGFAWMMKAYTPSLDLDLMSVRRADEITVGHTCYNIALIPLRRRRNYFGDFQQANSVPQNGTFLVRAILSPTPTPSPASHRETTKIAQCGMQRIRVATGTTINPDLRGSFMAISPLDDYPAVLDGKQVHVWDWFVRPEESGWQALHLELIAPDHSNRNGSHQAATGAILGVAAPVWIEADGASPMLAINTLTSIIALVSGLIAVASGLLGMRKDIDNSRPTSDGGTSADD